MRIAERRREKSHPSTRPLRGLAQGMLLKVRADVPKTGLKDPYFEGGIVDIGIEGVKGKVTVHKYVLEVKCVELEKPFKVVVEELFEKPSGKSLGWMAVPEIQLRQTVQLKQEYIISNLNPSPEMAVREYIAKMLMTSSREMFYKPDFEEKNNMLW